MILSAGWHRRHRLHSAQQALLHEPHLPASSLTPLLQFTSRYGPAPSLCLLGAPAHLTPLKWQRRPRPHCFLAVSLLLCYLTTNQNINILFIVIHKPQKNEYKFYLSSVYFGGPQTEPRREEDIISCLYAPDTVVWPESVTYLLA